MTASNRLVISMLAVAALAAAFWVLVLAPKREESAKLGTQVVNLRSALASSQNKASEAESARHAFPTDYQQLVVLGKALPPSDNTSSLLVEVSHIAHRSKVKFNKIELSPAAGEGASSTSTPSAPSAASSTNASPVPPTEAAASLLPLGASIGPAGLGVMPYELSFEGNFFHVADFIHGIDALIHTSNRNVAVDGRLVTLNGFALSASTQRPFPYLSANFSVTTYVTPPNQGVTAGATPTSPASPTATPTAATTSSEASTSTATSSGEPK